MFQLLPLNGLMKKGFDGNFTYFSERGNSTIDFFLSSFDFVSHVKSLNVVGRIESQHMPVRLDVCAALEKVNEQTDEIRSTEKVMWDPQKAQLFLDYLTSDVGQRSLDNATNTIEVDPDSALSLFVNTLLAAGQCMKRSVLWGGRARRTNKWFDTECRQLKRDVSRSLNKYIRSRTTDDRVTYLHKRSQYQTLIKEKKKAYKQSIHESLLQNRNNSNTFWSTIKRARSRVVNRVSIEINVWKDYFARVLGQRTATTAEQEPHVADVTVDDDVVVNVDDDGDDDVHISDLDDEITLIEVKNAIRRLKLGKASGLDEVVAEFLKTAVHIVSPFLTKLFNRLYDSGTFPDEWSKAVIVPLFKKGDTSNPENYRGISLLSIVSKVFTSILNKRLYQWAESEHKICEEQAGFRKHYATTDHIFSLVSMIKKCLYGQRRSKFYVVFVDYLKAFDSVDRDRLWGVLQKVKTSTKMLRMLQGMYKTVQSCVRWGADVSEFFDCPFGVRQGCQISPLIFSLLITEVADSVTSKGKHGFQFLPGLQEIFLLLFADDICLISTTPAGLQNQINNLEKASSALGLTVNLNKTKVMVFRKGGHLARMEKWYYQGHELEVVNSYKYLGFTLTTKLSFDIALEEFAGRAKGRVVEIMKTMWSLGNMDSTVFFKLFDAQVKPLLLYAAEIWGFTRFHSIESPHLFACKRFLNVSPKTPNAMVYGELGRYPLYIDSTLRALKYWFKLQSFFLVRIPRQAYEMDKNRLLRYALDHSDVHNWVYSVKHCLDIFGFSEVWQNGGVGNEKIFLRVFRQRMIDCYKQDWYSKIVESDRYTTYRSFKSLLQPERYLKDITITKFRNVFVKFRLGIVDLKINKRYQNVTLTCPFCDTVENELHFLLHCPKYNDLRQKYISRYYTNVHLSPLPFLLQSENTFITRSVAMYIYYALKLREESLMNF